tara:strand:+ start:357 stop:737 length:381 start_codon:yes stop_codon:yes gene_type:complete
MAAHPSHIAPGTWIPICTLALLLEAYILFHSTTISISLTSPRFLLGCTLPLLFMGYGLKKKSLHISGACMGWVVASANFFCHVSVFCALGTFFVTSSAFTKFKSKEKRKIEEGFKEGGQRDWVQVI